MKSPQSMLVLSACNDSDLAPPPPPPPSPPTRVHFSLSDVGVCQDNDNVQSFWGGVSSVHRNKHRITPSTLVIVAVTLYRTQQSETFDRTNGISAPESKPASALPPALPS
ncbi:hypothetical protein ACHAWF_007180 [Thalassiosira exigua]